MFKKISQMFRLLLVLMVMPIMGVIPVKSSEVAARKFSDRASGASTEYGENAQAAAETWNRNTAASADTFHMAVTAAGVKERFRRGVQKAGAAKYARKVADVGQARYAPGVAAAVDDYKSGVEPFLQTIAGLTLSQRKPKGDPANYRRVEEVGKALNAKKLAMLGSG